MPDSSFSPLQKNHKNYKLYYITKYVFMSKNKAFIFLKKIFLLDAKNDKIQKYNFLKYGDLL